MKSIPVSALALGFCLAAPVLQGAGEKGTGRPFYGDPPDDTHAWCVHDRNRPLPRVLKPGDAPGQPPCDATVLFDGKSLDAWESVKDGKPVPARWALKDGFMEVVPKTGILRTKAQFGDCQLHIEWATPDVVVGDGQGRGNSGVFLAGKYEVQVLDSFDNPTYADGGAGSIYAQNPPLVNVSRAPGQWQVYDIVFHPARFDASGAVVCPGSVTVFQNGVLVQDGWAFEGLAGHRARAKFGPHPDRGPLELQDHGNPMRFRNIWIREIPPRAKPTPETVARQRAEIAAKIRDAASKAEGLAKLELLLESLVYQMDPPTLEQADRLAGAYVGDLQKLDAPATKAREAEIKGMRDAFKYLRDKAIVPASFAHLDPIEKLMRARGLKFK